VEIQTAMEKGGDNVEKKNRVVIIVLVIVIIILVIGMIWSSNSKNPAADCLNGNQQACAYFYAQEEVSRLREELNAAKASLGEARAAYKNNSQ
jgi:flagellar basal body-associated protein FliL